MKIAQIVCTFPPYAGGMGNSALTIGELLSSQHQVSTFFPQKKKKKTIRTKQEISPLKAPLQYGHGAFLPQLLKKLRGYDRLYLHYPFFGTAELIWLFQVFSRKQKLIIHYHMDVTGLRGPARLLGLPSKVIFKSLFKKADIIITASLDYIENSQAAPIYKKHPEKFREIPFGVDTNKFRPAPGKFSRSPRILFVGGLDQAHYFKGVNKLLKALARLKDTNWSLDVVGEGDLRPEYQRKAKELGLENRISFPGQVNEEKLIEYYQQSDLFVLPSTDSSEAFGLVLIEAMACGLPVIASDLPGVRRVFRNGEEGLTTPSGDEKKLAEKLESLLTDPETRRKMGKKARKKAENKYSLDIMQKKLNQAIEGRSL